MVIASSFLLSNRRTAKLASFAPDEPIRSVQIYGVRPEQVREAVRRLVYDHGVSHVDMNFGCPVRKITARGGGSALPLRPKLFGRLVAAAVAGAEGAAPVTVKFRIGLTPQLTTHLQAGRIAEEEGAAALTLHARTADQLYYPPVDWSAIRQLVQAVRIPVIGNGDVYEGRDAVRMVRETGCAGVMVGRAALGRPWVYGEVAAALEQATSGSSGSGHAPQLCLSASPGPRLGEVVRTALQRHVEPEVAWYGDYDEGERDSLLRLRKFVPLYLHGFTSAGPLRAALLRAETLDQWRAAAYDERLYDADEPYPSTAVRFPRLKGGGVAARQSMGLPNGWLAAEGEGEGGPGAEAEARLADDVCEG